MFIVVHNLDNEQKQLINVRYIVRVKLSITGKSRDGLYYNTVIRVREAKGMADIYVKESIEEIQGMLDKTATA